MTLKSWLRRLCAQEDINFLLTNRIPRHLATGFLGRISHIEHPLVCKLSISLWRLFSDVELQDASKTSFRSLHECFTRALKEGSRPTDWRPEILTSPCDAIIGASGTIQGTEVHQIKGFCYRLEDLLPDPLMAETLYDGCYVTLRLTSGMYHRFHAPHDCTVDQVTYISGDTWNVNPITLRRIERLFCKNERAVLHMTLTKSGHQLAMVPVAAILVASIRLHFADVLLHLRYRGPNIIQCDARLQKGQEMGWFQHGSTILLFAPKGFALCDNLQEGTRIRVGDPLMFLPV